MTVTLIPILIINYYFIIKPKIYYIIDYNLNLSNEIHLIDTVELLNYDNYLDCEDCYFDRNILNSYKKKIDNDYYPHIDPFYTHRFRYNFTAIFYPEIELSIYTINLMGNNITTFSFNAYNHKILDFDLEPGYPCYLNYSIIPQVQDTTSPFLLNNITTVKIQFDYKLKRDFVYPCFSEGIQYLFLTRNFEMVLIFSPIMELGLICWI